MQSLPSNVSDLEHEMKMLLGEVLEMRKRKKSHYFSMMNLIFGTLQDDRMRIKAFHMVLKKRMAVDEPKRIHNKKMRFELSNVSSCINKILFALQYIDKETYVEDLDERYRVTFLAKNKYDSFEYDDYIREIPHELEKLKSNPLLAKSNEAKALILQIDKAVDRAIHNHDNKKTLEALFERYENYIVEKILSDEYMSLMYLHENMVNYLIFDNAIRNISMAVDAVRPYERMRKELIFRIAYDEYKWDERPYIVIQDDVIFFQPRDDQSKETTLLTYRVNPGFNTYQAIHYLLDTPSKDKNITLFQLFSKERCKKNIPFSLSLEHKGNVIFKYKSHVEDYKRVKVMNVLSRIVNTEYRVFFDRMVAKLKRQNTPMPEVLPPMFHSPYITPHIYKK